MINCHPQADARSAIITLADRLLAPLMMNHKSQYRHTLIPLGIAEELMQNSMLT